MRCGRRPLADGKGRPGRVHLLDGRPHTNGGKLRYLGFNGSGKQVRDVLHVADLADLVERPALISPRPLGWRDGERRRRRRSCSLSLRETTELCREITGNVVDVAASDEERPGDVAVYISDCAKLFGLTDWRPRRDPRSILADIHEWITDTEDAIRAAW